jgi:hypothetical protein
MDARDINIFLGACVVGLVHGLLPNHWLPFILVGRAQKWSTRVVASILLGAGVAHVAIAGAIAMAAMFFGMTLFQSLSSIGRTFQVAVLGFFGVLFVSLDLMSIGGHHHGHIDEKRMSDSTAITFLVLSLALSPCEALVPVYISVIPRNDPVLLLSLVVFSGAITVVTMFLLAMLAWRGIMRWKFAFISRHERAVVGSVLVVLALLSFI